MLGKEVAIEACDGASFLLCLITLADDHQRPKFLPLFYPLLASLFSSPKESSLLHQIFLATPSSQSKNKSGFQCCDIISRDKLDREQERRESLPRYLVDNPSRYSSPTRLREFRQELRGKKIAESRKKKGKKKVVDRECQLRAGRKRGKRWKRV